MTTMPKSLRDKIEVFCDMGNRLGELSDGELEEWVDRGQELAPALARWFHEGPREAPEPPEFPVYYDAQGNEHGEF